MYSNHLCPFCSFPLLSHIRGGKLYWFCQSCTQEVPYGIYQGNPIINNYSENEPKLPLLTKENALNQINKNIKIKDLFFGGNLRNFLMTIQQFLEADRVILSQVDSTGKILVIAESLRSGFSTMTKTKVNHFLSRETINKLRRGQTEYIKNLSEYLEPESLGIILASIFSLKSQLAIPIMVKDSEQKFSFLWGIIIAHTCYKIAPWTQKQINLCQLIAKQIGLNIEEENRYQKLCNLINYDEFTKLANRHYFEDILEQKWQYLSQLKAPISLIMCEMNIKKSNSFLAHELEHNYQEQLIHLLEISLGTIENLISHYREQNLVILLPNFQDTGTIIATIKSEFISWKQHHENEDNINYLTLNLGAATITPTQETLSESLIVAAYDDLIKQKKLAAKYPPINNLEKINIRKIEPVTNEELLMSYVAYFLSRGKAIITPYHGQITFENQVYQYSGYNYDFVNFWQKLRQKKEFPEFYLEGDTHNFAEFLSGNYTVNPCSRCNLPIPTPVGAAYDIPSCHLCEHKKIDREYKIIIFREQYSHFLEKLLRINGFKCYIFTQPDVLFKEYLNLDVDLILIDHNITPKIAENWSQKLHDHEQLKEVPIIALTNQARKVLPWQEQELGIIDYVLTPLNGEYLASHLKKICQLESSLSKNKLHWFPK